MIGSLLVANRGEIACRIIRTCRRMGIQAIAVFSEADAGALHVELADARRCIGPPEATLSYLNSDAIVGTALELGADAIHPGYGFLSEKTVLPELCAGHGLIWVGPSARVIALMGSKIESKRLALGAGVPCIPGYDGDDQDPQRLLDEATRIGFPLLIKASAGGGGKGMRRVDQASDFGHALELAKREARAAFGDERVLLEKFILRPRHIEVQLAGDQHGNLIHLFERECSIQRNYQKLVEEAPAPKLSAAVRDELFEAALRLARSIGYDSVGTVEFIFDTESGRPYFLEMNTRLQVEHPVTEMVAGVDLVELQIRIAAGEYMPFTQGELQCRGSAIEVRLNAEDPASDYSPQLGRITFCHEPTGEGVRVDNGVRANTEVSPYYDSLLAKVIAHGSHRNEAASRLAVALDRFTLLGVGTNRDFQRDIVRHPLFISAQLTTQFLQDAFPDGWRPAKLDHVLTAAIAGVLWASARVAGGSAAQLDPWRSLSGFRVTAAPGRLGEATLQVRAAGHLLETVTVASLGDLWRAEVEDTHFEFRITETPAGLLVRHGASAHMVIAQIENDCVQLSYDGRTETLRVMPSVEAFADKLENETSSGSDIIATMPGLVTAVEATVGQTVRRNDPVIIMEAMKLVLSIVAPTDGKVKAVHCRPGQTVAGGACLVEIEPLSREE